MFMPVGTQATVKGLTPRMVEECGASIILGNTYHLALRPGADIVAEMGGLHRFMDWPGSILTDSGGYQIFSLAEQRKITDAGATFRSHIDGALLELTPEKAVEIQEKLGSDIAMVLDECPPGLAEPEVVRNAMRRSILWAKRCPGASNVRRSWLNSTSPVMPWVVSVSANRTHRCCKCWVKQHRRCLFTSLAISWV
jgi:queuine tRNA-ribosyltransferase